MKIEYGKYYKTRDGRKVGPMKHSGFDEWPWIETEGNGICWMDDGSPVKYTKSPKLIAEWQNHDELMKPFNGDYSFLTSTYTGIPDGDAPYILGDEPTTDEPDLAALAAQHRIKITVQVGEALIEYDGRVNP